MSERIRDQVIDFPRIEPFEAIDDASRFLNFADDAAARFHAFWTLRARAAILRAASVPAILRGGDDRPAIRAALGDLARLTGVACGTGVGIAFSYPGTVRGILASSVDLDRVRLHCGERPALHVAFFACVRDDRSVLESFRFSAVSPDGSLTPVRPREELLLTFAFREVAELAVASLRDALGDGRTGATGDAFAPLLERIGSRTRAYLERAVAAREIDQADPQDVCELAATDGAACAGHRYRVRGETFEPAGSGSRARCGEHLIPLLDNAVAGLALLGIESSSWFSERAAGVVVASGCPACGRETEVPVVVTDRRVLHGDRAMQHGLGAFFERYANVSVPQTPCCVAHARTLSLPAIADRVACDEFDAGLRLVWTCDVRAFVARGEAACGLRGHTHAAGAGASRLYDLEPLRAPRFEVPLFVRASALESR
jgi:hypothetical protein